MGCDPACEQRKAANASPSAQQIANSKKNSQVAAGIKSGNVTVTAPDPNNVMTVGKMLQVDKIQNALSLTELASVLGAAAPIAGAASGLVGATVALVSVFQGLIIGETIFGIVKPIVKTVMNITGILFNPANIGEMIQDIVFLIFGIIVLLLPIFIDLLKNIIFNTVIYRGNITVEVVWEFKKASDLQLLDIKNETKKCISGFDFKKSLSDKNGVNQKLQNMGFSPVSVIDLNININTPQGKERMRKNFENSVTIAKETMNTCTKNAINSVIPNKADVLDTMNSVKSPTMSKEDVTADQFLEGLFEASKKIEMLKTAALLDKNFALSEEELDILENTDPAKFYSILAERLDVLKEKSLEATEDLSNLPLVENLIIDNKNQIIDGINEAISKIGNIPINGVNACVAVSIENELTALKASAENHFIGIIDVTYSSITNTAGMLSLVNAIKTDTFIENYVDQNINSLDPVCISQFHLSICGEMDSFKKELYKRIKKSIDLINVTIDQKDIPASASKESIDKLKNTVLDELKKSLMDKINQVLYLNPDDCQACKPCEQMQSEIVDFINIQRDLIEKNMMKYIVNDINAYNSWTVTTPLSIINKKNYLKTLIHKNLLKSKGSIDINFEIRKRLIEEQNSLIKTVKALFVEVK